MILNARENVDSEKKKKKKKIRVPDGMTKSFFILMADAVDPIQPLHMGHY